MFFLRQRRLSCSSATNRLIARSQRSPGKRSAPGVVMHHIAADPGAAYGLTRATKATAGRRGWWGIDACGSPTGPSFSR